MDILSLLIVLVVVGFALWAVNTYIPMDGKVKQIMNVIVIGLLVIWILSALLGYGPVVRLGR